MTIDKNNASPRHLTPVEIAAEEWRQIATYEGIYEVSNLGRVRSASGLVMRQVVSIRPGHRCGYARIRLSKRGVSGTYGVHALVATAFLGPRPAGLVCRHLNGDGTDNRAENLAWGTQSQNQRDRIEHGTACLGDDHPRAKLSSFKVLCARALLDLGAGPAAIGRALRVSGQTISDVHSGRTWSHVLPSEEVGRG